MCASKIGAFFKRLLEFLLKTQKLELAVSILHDSKFSLAQAENWLVCAILVDK